MCSSVSPLASLRFSVGRAFLPEEDRAGADRVVVLSHGLWRQRYGAGPTIIGQKITLNNEAYTVIGVTAPDFQFPRRGEIPSYFDVATKPDLYLPAVILNQLLRQRQPKADARLFGREIRLEDLPQRFRRDPVAGVGDLKPDIVFLRAQRDLERSAASRRFEFSRRESLTPAC